LKKFLLFIIIIIISFSFFTFGYIFHQNSNLFLNTTISNNSSNLLEDFSKKTLTNFDVKSIIHIQNNNDATEIRNNLVDYIFKKNIFLDKMPDKIIKNIDNENYYNIFNLKQIDEITIMMKHDVNSVAFLFHPINSNNQLIIYHQGHSGDFYTGKNSIETFLNDGFTVLAFTMPLLGNNNNPILDHDSFGKIKLTSHKQFVLLETNSFSPIQYFVEPIIISLNYLDKNYNFDSSNMVGISGGGWTTTLVSAIDERINDSFSISGSYPIYLRYQLKNLGDYEQLEPKLYNVANYLDLYILSSIGQDRSHTQIFIKDDSCCFGDGEFLHYDQVLTNHVSTLDGSFRIIEDDSIHSHNISETTLKLISNLILQ
jgi:hypothetical protein